MEGLKIYNLKTGKSMRSAKKLLNEDWNINSLSKYVAEIVMKESGNVIGKKQESMVLSRLKKRLIDLGDISPNQYFDYLTKNYEKESIHLVSILTTHHTFFFREFCHFEYILKDLDNIVERVKSRGERKIRIFSAACSRGQEVYSLAMFFNHHLKSYPGMSCEIWGTDIDPESVQVAKNGVYNYKEVKSIPNIYLKGNWQRGTGDIAQFARVKEDIKSYCHFDVMNLLETGRVLGNKKFDLIFCRNVFIYFDEKAITEIVTSLKEHLYPHSYLITGLSESLKSIEVDKNTHAPSVYTFDKIEEVKTSSEVIELPKKAKKPIVPEVIRVLAVDDSASVLKLLKKIFESDNSFELVGTATNGLEVEEFLKNNEVDIMTLDIHMPEMDGVEYLKKNYKKGHPHVVVISSASREDTRYAQETLKHGACDFVEKPAINNLAQRAEEIKNKLKMAFLNNSTEVISKGLDESFKKSFQIKDCDKKARLFFSSFSDLKKVSETLKALKGEQPPVFMFFEGNGNFLEVIQKNISERVEVFDDNTKVASNKVYLCDFDEHSSLVKEILGARKVSSSIFGICSKKVESWIMDLNNFQLLLEDIPGINEGLKEVASDIFPFTSFSHVGTEFLAEE